MVKVTNLVRFRIKGWGHCIDPDLIETECIVTC